MPTESQVEEDPEDATCRLLRHRHPELKFEDIPNVVLRTALQDADIYLERYGVTQQNVRLDGYLRCLYALHLLFKRGFIRDAISISGQEVSITREAAKANSQGEEYLSPYLSEFLELIEHSEVVISA